MQGMCRTDGFVDRSAAQGWGTLLSQAALPDGQEGACMLERACVFCMCVF